MKNIGLYAGSFDPFTIGHLSILCKALCSYDQIVIGIGQNPEKEKPLFTPKERVKLIEKSIEEFVENYKNRRIVNQTFSRTEMEAIDKLINTPDCIRVIEYAGYTIDTAIKYKAKTLIRGKRLFGDNETEDLLEKMNDDLAEIRGVNIKTEKITVPKVELTYVSSSLCKSFCQNGEYIQAQKFLSNYVLNAMMEKYLEKEFIELCEYFSTDKTTAKSQYNQLINAYAINRQHHNLSHIAYGINYIQMYNENERKIPNLKELKFAMFLHDFINNGKQNDEELSAKEALSFIKDANPEQKEKIYKYIMATAHMDKDNQTGLLDLEEQIISDVDLMILGDERNYGKYAHNIRKEYAYLDEEDYSKGRIAVLNKFINKPKIFKTKYFAKFENTAKDNISRERDYWLGVENDINNSKTIPLKTSETGKKRQ